MMSCSLLCGSMRLRSLFCGLLYHVPSPTDLDAVLPVLLIFDVASLVLLIYDVVFLVL